MKLATIAVGLIIAVIGLVGVVVPSILFEFGRSLQTMGELYVIAVVRVILGVALVLVPSTARMPRTLRVIGILMIVGGLVTPLFGVERIHEIVEWWSSQGTFMARAWAGLGVILGLFIIYAVGSPRTRGSR